MDLLFVIHFIAFCLSDAYFCPLRSDKDYKRLFVRNFRYISLMSVLYFVFFIAYVFLSGLFFSENYIDSFFNEKMAFFLIFYTIIIFAFTLFIVRKEIDNASYEAKNAKSLLMPAIYLFLYTSSVMWGGFVIHFTNNLFDFSRGERLVRKIDRGSVYTSSGRYKTKSYYFSISPDVYGLHRFKVPSYLFDKARYLSKSQLAKREQTSEMVMEMNGELKLVVYVYNGLYGIRYVGKSMDVTK